MKQNENNEACELCGNIQERDQIEYPDNTTNQKTISFSKISLCTNCGFGWAEPRKDQVALDQFYSSGQYWETGQSNTLSLTHQNVQAHFRMKEYSKYLDKKEKLTVLEIGSGYGSLIRLFFTSFGDSLEKFYFIEPDDKAADFILKAVNDKRLLRLSSVEEINEKIDAVILNHVLEHVSSPVSFLDSLKETLNSDGLLFIETPRYDFLFKESVFPHTLFFNLTSYKALASTLNLEIKNIREFGSSRCIQKDSRVKFFNRARGKLFSLSVKYGPLFVQKMTNNFMFDYSSESDKIWISGVFQLKK